MRSLAENFILKLIEKRNSKEKSEEEKKQNKKDTCSVFTLILRLRQFCDDPCMAIPNFSSNKTQNEIKKELERKMQQDLAAEEIDPNELLGEDLCVKCHFEDEMLTVLRCGHKICRDCMDDDDEEAEPECPDCSRPAPIERPFRMMREDSDASTVFPMSVAASLGRRGFGRPIERVPERRAPVLVPPLA